MGHELMFNTEDGVIICWAPENIQRMGVSYTLTGSTVRSSVDFMKGQHFYHDVNI